MDMKSPKYLHSYRKLKAYTGWLIVIMSFVALSWFRINIDLACRLDPSVKKRPVQRMGGGRGCNNFVPVLGGNGTDIGPTEEIFDQPPGQMRCIWGKLADHVGDHVHLWGSPRVSSL